MNWQLVIAIILLAPIAAIPIVAWGLFTLYVWSAEGRGNRVDWVAIHVVVMGLAGTLLLLDALGMMS